jgi:hypothetical protein
VEGAVVAAVEGVVVVVDGVVVVPEVPEVPDVPDVPDVVVSSVASPVLVLVTPLPSRVAVSSAFAVAAVPWSCGMGRVGGADLISV